MSASVDEASLIALLAEAQRAGRRDVDQSLLASLDRAAAYRVQRGVMAALGEQTGLLKTAIAADGVGVAAPIFASRVGRSGSFELPLQHVIGIELEVALVLGRDISVEAALADPAALTDGIAHHILGLEICGTRYRDRKAAVGNAGLADSMSAFGYVINPAQRELGAEIEGFDVDLSLDGQSFYSAPARHSFGTVLASFVAYAQSQHPDFPLLAGTIVTTGSLCGLVPVPGPGTVTARLGNAVVSCRFS